jgi:hypothetical protein
MPLSLNEIKDRALAFSREWEVEKAERAEAVEEPDYQTGQSPCKIIISSKQDCIISLNRN